MRLLTVKEVAQTLNIRTRSVQLLITSGKLRGMRLGNHFRIAPDDLESFISGITYIPSQKNIIDETKSGGIYREGQ